MKITLKLLLLFIPLFSNAQKQGNIWYFGNQAGLDFSNGIPVVLTGGQTGTDAIGGPQEGTSCISDSTGKLLFYTGGQKIWNRNHNPMINGTGIMGGTSSTQSSLIVPLPGNDNLYYVFTTDEFQNSFPASANKGYRYSIVDMCLDKENGDVVSGQKNILLIDSATEKLAACEDATGNGYWVVGHKMLSNEFYSWHLTSGGITNTVVSKIGTIHGWNNSTATWIYPAAQGQMMLNSSGTKLALAISNFDPAYLDLFDFNNNTGIVSNFCHIVIDSALNKRIWGVEFSPDNSKLYVTLSGGSGGKRIYQYDLTAGGGVCNSIISSRITLYQSFTNSVMFGLQLAPNGKIYLVGNTYSDLSCINYPNLTGIAAGYDSSAITLTGSNNYMLPSFIAGYKYHNRIPHCTTKIIDEIEKNYNIVIYPNPAKNDITIIAQFKTDLEIQNLNGQIIKSIMINDKLTIIDLGNISSGVYIIKAKTAKGLEIKKFIKE